ncbi:uncharacterized protein N7482_000004 [Penicillium canariense]|uniref:NWD NACHT-NTPase N-terminal domain-containing protein n=1 Tax=Penicillium canariense TaxID=189055 RepID=A0A9W9ID10_9EURO|nr:uncharacterized protein N7482_000004 [Penicillium canariense]KAJ5174127.1 hypothetical protein N7482_000004 [Penicillium canariense]
MRFGLKFKWRKSGTNKSRIPQHPTSTRQKAGGSGSDAGPNPAVSPSSSQSSSKDKQPLWEKAYDELRRDEADLVASFERIMTSESQASQEWDRSSSAQETQPQNRQQRLSLLVNEKIKQMNNRKWRFKIGQKDVKVREMVDQIVKIMMIAKDCVSAAANLDPVHVGLPWAGICVLLPRNDALDGLEYISVVVSRFVDIEQLYLQDRPTSEGHDLEVAIVQLYRQVLEYQARSSCQFNRNTAVQTVRNMVTVDNWKGIIEKIKSSETECDKIMRILDIKDQRDRMQSLKSLMEEQECRVQEVLKIFQLEEKTSRKILELLRTTDYETFKARNGKRVPGTCSWFLRHRVFQDWQTSTMGYSLLWVSADPGCGKSVLARSLIENELKSTDSRSTCYFFFKEDNDRQRTITVALCALLHQLFAQNPALIRHAQSAYSVEGENLRELAFQLWDILVRASSDPEAGEIVCVLDALDECEELSRRQFIGRLTELFENNHDNKEKKARLKLLVTSRLYFDIERSFRPMTKQSSVIHLKGEEESKAISVEIDLVIKSEIPKITEEFYLSSKEQDFLEQELLSVPHRTYLWLKLILEVIHNELSVTETKLRRILGTIPSSLDKAYDAILNRSPDIERARKLLTLVVSAVRPLTLGEMRVALALKPDSRSYDQLDLENESTFEMTVRNLCGLFPLPEDPRHIPNSLMRFSLLGIPVAVKSLLDEMKGVAYYHSICPLRFVNAQGGSGQTALSLVAQKGDLEMVTILLTHGADVNARKKNGAPPLSLAAAEGHEATANLLLEYGAKVECKDKHGHPPLWYAVCRGKSISIIKALLDWGANLEYQDRAGRTVLFWAALTDDESLVRLILSKGANMDHKDKKGMTPFLYAAAKKRPRALKVFLESNANVNAIGPRGCSALCLSAEFWPLKPESFYRCEPDDKHELTKKLCLETMRVLLDNGADPEIENVDGQTALSRAVYHNSFYGADLLLERGANLEHVDLKHRTPLQIACSQKPGVEFMFHYTAEPSVEILLRHGANIEHKDNLGFTALALASMHNFHSLARNLLNHGARIETRDNLLFTPLGKAAYEGWYQVVTTLLMMGAHVEVKNTSGLTPLALAVMNSQQRKPYDSPRKRDSLTRNHVQADEQVLLPESHPTATVKIGDSLSMQRDTTANHENIYTPRNHLRVAELLLLRKADVSVTAENGQSLLLIAVCNGDVEMVRLLLKWGANMEWQEGDEITAITCAEANGHQEILALLRGKVEK